MATDEVMEVGSIRSAPHLPRRITPGKDQAMTSQMYNATIELEVPIDNLAGDPADKLLDRFADYHPVLARSTLGRAELILSLPAQSLWQAASTVRHLVDDLPATRVILETSTEFDLRSHADVPHLLSVTEAAQRLGITRAGVQRKIDTGTLPAVRVGNAWAIPAVAAEAAAAAQLDEAAGTAQSRTVVQLRDSGRQ